MYYALNYVPPSPYFQRSLPSPSPRLLSYSALWARSCVPVISYRLHGTVVRKRLLLRKQCRQCHGVVSILNASNDVVRPMASHETQRHRGFEILHRGQDQNGRNGQTMAPEQRWHSFEVESQPRCTFVRPEALIIKQHWRKSPGVIVATARCKPFVPFLDFFSVAMSAHRTRPLSSFILHNVSHSRTHSC